MKLDQLEERLKTLIEIDLLHYPQIKISEGVIAQQLARALNSNIQEENGKKTGPNTYTLSANPSNINRWKTDKTVVGSLNQVIEIIAAETDIKLNRPLSFSLAPNPKLAINEIRILASHRIKTIAETQGMETKKEEEKNTSEEKVPNNAFLIVHGTKVFPLTKSVVDIGRRIENDLTVDDPRVSRNHAQLRVVKGRYVIFDLNSTGGTYVNSKRSHQSVLYPGDVISLAGVPLIFGQDNPPHRADLRETAPFQPGMTTERPTAILRQPPGFEVDDED